MTAQQIVRSFIIHSSIDIRHSSYQIPFENIKINLYLLDTVYYCLLIYYIRIILTYILYFSQKNIKYLLTTKFDLPKVT